MRLSGYGSASISRHLAATLAIPLIGVVLAFVFPTQLNFLMLVVTMMIFVLSLDLTVGYAGIVTLGQAAFFGVGAYCAGLYALHVTAEPLTGLLVGLFGGAFIAFVTGLLVLRAHGLTLLMMTIAAAQIIVEIASRARPVTGGDDGLYGWTMSPILGIFEFDFFGRTGFGYALAILTIVFFLLRVLTTSPFGQTAVGIREDRERMSAMGADVYWHLVRIYTISGAVAGLAGAVSAQTVQVVGLNSLGFTMSAEALVMLVLGGTGRLWGALAGTLIFMVIHHSAAELDPIRWMLFIGAMLVAVVLFVPGGLVNGLARLSGRLARMRGGA